jgi:hypothetical protein
VPADAIAKHLLIGQLAIAISVLSLAQPVEARGERTRELSGEECEQRALEDPGPFRFGSPLRPRAVFDELRFDETTVFVLQNRLETAERVLTSNTLEL